MPFVIRCSQSVSRTQNDSSRATGHEHAQRDGFGSPSRHNDRTQKVYINFDDESLFYLYSTTRCELPSENIFRLYIVGRGYCLVVGCFFEAMNECSWTRFLPFNGIELRVKSHCYYQRLDHLHHPLYWKERGHLRKVDSPTHSLLDA